MADQVEVAEGDGERGLLERALDTALSVQQPVIDRQVARIRRDRPDWSPREVLAELERRYVKAVTVAGAAVGGSAAVPGIGTGLGATLSAAEVIGFLEASAAFTLAVAHVHGIDVADVERRRALVLSVLLGSGGGEAVGDEARRAGAGLGGPWGELVAGRLPRPSVQHLNRVLLRRFLGRFGSRQGVLAVGRVVPFGIGAAVGASGNRVLGRRVVRGAKAAFGPPPRAFADEVDAGV